MDNLTHGLTGVGIAFVTQEVINIPQPGLVVTALIASQLPDLDVLIGSKDKTAYLKHHRGFSHSLLLAPIFSLFIALGVKIFTPQTNFWLLFGVGFLSLGLHLFFDLLNAYGTKLFWPISNRRFAWDILMIVDPFLIIIFGLGIYLHLFKGENSLLFSLYPFLGLYILSMVNFRLKAKKYLYNKFKKNVTICLLPPLLGWRKWNFIVEKEEVFYLGKIDSYTGQLILQEKLAPEEECNLVKSTKDDPQVRVFLDFARFPWHSKENIENNVVVRWSDLRYRLRERDHFYLLAKPKLKN